jgi:ABC-type polysaccharide/polyol phosphate transport system ATPase subunit
MARWQLTVESLPDPLLGSAATMSGERPQTGSTIERPRPELIDGPVVIEVRDVVKEFVVPEQRMDTFKERVTHPIAKRGGRRLRALRGVSFDVHRGEFFGIVGRNGSGKSTLLKIMASIYRADRGRLRMAGRLAPFIELGVGFNPELTSRENVVLNGVLMGLSRQEARRRLDSVLEFSELREFADLKLKNYSSGMMVRLAFAVMVQADADIMLIDEVLAVGDAAFAQKCVDVFRERRNSGKTVVLVTHDMATVQSFCDRAMLLEEGEMKYLGDPEETALRYYRMNFGGRGERGQPQDVPDVNARLIDVWLENPAGERVANVEQAEPVGFNVIFEARHDLVNPVFGFHFHTADGNQVFGFTKHLDVAEGAPDVLREGQRVRLSGTIENRLLPGRYFVSAMISRNRSFGDLALHVLRLIDFVVYGTEPGPGSVSIEVDMEAAIEDRP